MYAPQAYRRLSPEPAQQGEASARDFEQWERIGRGGFGKVYRARACSGQFRGSQVAIKVIDKQMLRDATAEQRVATEVAVHEGLDHAHVVRVLDSFEDDRAVYLVMELCEGGDLWRYLRQRQKQLGGSGLARLDEMEARRVVRQVASALAHLHGLGILHRDLKLANVLLTRSMDVRLADFGLATEIGASEPVTMCGTPSYISPEILARQPYGFESDVWALGCLFVTLLTGTQPFRNLKRITDEAIRAVRLPATISDDARGLVRAMLRIDPRHRIRAADIPTHPFFNSLLAEPRLPTLAQLESRQRRVLPPPGPAADRPRRVLQEPRSTYYGDRPASTNLGFTGQVEAETANPRPAAPGPNTADLAGFSTQRLSPLKRSMKNGKVYLRADHLLVLDLAHYPMLVAMDENAREIYELPRTLPLQINTLSIHSAHSAYPWDMSQLPERVAKAVRVGCRCVAYLLSQQKRIRVATPQGKGYYFDDRDTFKLLFFNGIRVDMSRRRMEATVEIPAKEDLPNEIQKLALDPGDFSPHIADRKRSRNVPEKVRGILDHSREALRQVLVLDQVLARANSHVEFPVDLRWDTADLISAGDMDLPKPSSLPQQPPQQRRAKEPARLLPSRRPASIAQTAGSTTVVTSRQSQQPQQWGAHLLDRRTVDDTPTRRLNLGPITRLVEEFNQMRTSPAPRNSFLRTPGSLMRGSANNHSLMRQAFENVCFLPQAGWCMAAEGSDSDDYMITMLFVDGCRVLVKVKDQLMCYRDAEEEYDDLPFDHSMPTKVKERLSWLPQFLNAMNI